MLKLVLGDEHLRVRFEAGYDGGRNEGSGAGPSLRRMGVPFEVSAGLEEEGQGCNHHRGAAGVGEKIGDEVDERFDRFSNNMFNCCYRCEEDDRKDAHFLIGQECSGFERKLPWSQKSELISSKVEPDLVSRSAGLRGPGHQNQISEFFRAIISITLVP